MLQALRLTCYDATHRGMHRHAGLQQLLNDLPGDITGRARDDNFFGCINIQLFGTGHDDWI
eukprot:scaffold8005_cov275-Amphora_coffeaeformis.AAC.30